MVYLRIYAFAIVLNYQTIYEYKKYYMIPTDIIIHIFSYFSFRRATGGDANWNSQSAIFQSPVPSRSITATHCREQNVIRLSHVTATSYSLSKEMMSLITLK